jgi:hypothetical protein
MEFVKLLMANGDERARFAADPDATLSHHGFAGLSAADVHDAVELVQETVTVDWSQAYGAGASATHTAPVETSTALDTSGWWMGDEPEAVADHEVPDLHVGP